MDNPTDVFNRNNRRLRMALELMIQASIETQDWMFREKWTEQRSDISLLKEFCTVKVCGPRRCGHTTSMVEVAYQYFEGPVFIVQNLALGKHVEEIILPRFSFRLKNPIRIVSMPAMQRNLRGISADAIFVDMAAFLSKTKEDELYQLALPSAQLRFAEKKPFCIVMME